MLLFAPPPMLLLEHATAQNIHVGQINAYCILSSLSPPLLHLGLVL